jgi:iron only hydrogenase large subunit-like protein
VKLNRQSTQLVLMESLIKSMYARQWRVSREKVWHLNTIPCFDKKLEANREGFKEDGTRDADCVVTTAELVKMIEDRGLNMMQLAESQNLSEI